MELRIVEPIDDFQPSDEDLKDHWCGEGHLVFKVLSYDPSTSFCPYEIDCQDYTGCVGGLDETLGIEYAVNEGILDCGKLRIGLTYTLTGITVHRTRGDGWTTDDDEEYEVEDVTTEVYLRDWLSAWWWHLVGHRIRNWRHKK